MRFTPAAEVYRMAARQLGVGKDRLRMVAALRLGRHGSASCGLKAAFFARAGQVLNPLGGQPDIVGRDLREIASRIIEMDESA